MDTSSLSEELIEALGRMPRENQHAWKALLDYACMDHRSLDQLSRRYQSHTESAPTKQLSTLKKWSTKYKWQTRLIGFDRIQAEKKAEEWIRRREMLNERGWGEGNTIRDKLLQMYKTHEEIGELRLLVSAWVDADKVQRLSVDAPTDNHKHSGAVLNDDIKRALDELGYEQKARVIVAATPDPGAGEEQETPA